MKPFLLLIFVGISAAQNACPLGMTSLQFMCYRPVTRSTDFKNAIQACLNLGNELIPVQKLRYFARENKDAITGSSQGLFRVNAIHNNVTWLEYVNGKLQEISFTNFPNFDASQGKAGDTLLWHPSTKELYIYPYSAFSIRQYRLMPLCYEPRRETDACTNDCCDNGDCFRGTCTCYSGWLASQNCCCRDFKLTITLIDKTTGTKIVNKGVIVTLASGKKLTLVSNNEGVIEINGCSLSPSARSFHTGTITVAGFCPTTYTLDDSNLTEDKSITVTLGKEAVLTMIVMNSVTFTPIAGAKVLVNAEELTSDAEGKVKLDKCVDDKVMVSTDVTDFCASPSTEIVLQPDDNVRIFLVKPKGEVSVNVRDASTCGPLAGADVAMMLSGGGDPNATGVSDADNGKVLLNDCLYSTNDIYAAKDMFCSDSTNIFIVDPANTNNAYLDLQPMTGLSVKVQDQDGVALQQMTVTLASETHVDMHFVDVTDTSGVASFTGICYGDDALITVFGGGFDSKDCNQQQEKVVIGSTTEITVSVACLGTSS